jgi:hypothetical protein
MGIVKFSENQRIVIAELARWLEGSLFLEM